MKKGLILTAIGGVLAAVGIGKMLKKGDVIDNDVEFIDCEEEAEDLEEENSEE